MLVDPRFLKTMVEFLRGRDVSKVKIGGMVYLREYVHTVADVLPALVGAEEST